MESYCQIILQAIDAVAITETTYKAITNRIHTLISKKLAKLACSCLDSLITKQLLPMELENWLDQTFVTRLYVTVHIGSALDEDAISGIRQLLDAIAKQIPRGFSPLLPRSYLCGGHRRCSTSRKSTAFQVHGAGLRCIWRLTGRANQTLRRSAGKDWVVGLDWG